MKNRFIALLVAVCALTFGFSTAHANKPLDVDCDDLKTTLTTADVILDAGGIGFPNLGQLVSMSKKDPAQFAELSGLLFAVSGGTIDFQDAKEVVPTIAKCGLVPHLIGLINN